MDKTKIETCNSKWEFFVLCMNAYINKNARHGSNDWDKIAYDLIKRAEKIDSLIVRLYDTKITPNWIEYRKGTFKETENLEHLHTIMSSGGYCVPCCMSDGCGDCKLAKADGRCDNTFSSYNQFMILLTKFINRVKDTVLGTDLELSD